MTIAPPGWTAPSEVELTTALAEIVGKLPRLVERRPVRTQSTFPAELIDLQIGDTPPFSLYCKYSTGPLRDRFGHRGGVPYEAEVYRRVLSAARMTTPRFFGVHRPVGTEDTWLFLESLDGAHWVFKTSDRDSMNRAAKWIAEFHNRLAATSLSSEQFLIRYDAEYFEGWIQRTREFAGGDRQSSWLRRLADRREEVAGRLAALPKTLIHGECTLRNLLYRDGVVHVVDWESAAVGPGEIDLACMTDGWRSNRVAEMERSYFSVRHGRRTSTRAQHALALARIYVHVRWLGDRPEWTRSAEAARRFAELRRLFESLGPGRT